MGAGLRVATIRGIVVQVHPTFALALAWAVYYWGIAPGAGLRGVLFGLAVVVAVFTCVVGHELAHGFTAQRHGLAVYDITLLPIGGVARIEQVPLPPRREAEIALAGPLLNVLVALGLLPALAAVALARGATNPLALLLLMRETSTSALLAHVWLANVMLALFNLLPAFPMDGGRIVRAGLTCLTNRLTATRAAVALGRLLALGLVVGGLATHDWALPLVALFVVIAARSESRMIHVEEAFRSLPVGQFALWDMGGVSPDSPLGYALRGGPRDVAVIENGVVVGML
ncbi:MAG: site-2 protease family protein, partial [Thermomicrobiaceae bacterium]|nr:site-2 protease family protein [Thermomicrobiaceae bacterium]